MVWAWCLWLFGTDVGLDKVVPGPLHMGHLGGIGGVGVSMSQKFPWCFVLELHWCDGWSWSRYGLGVMGYSVLVLTWQDSQNSSRHCPGLGDIALEELLKVEWVQAGCSQALYA